MRRTTIARCCHEANRVLTGLVGDVAVQPAWDDSPEEMRIASLRGVDFALTHPDATPEEQHEAWARDKRSDGWVWGPAKDSDAKTHPALVPYAELAPGTRAKDELFRVLVRSLATEVTP